MIRLLWALLLCAVCHAAWSVAWASPAIPRPRQLTVADGLPSNSINGIAEDQSGYLWIATSDGLARYDGITFRIWRAGDGLLDNYLWSVHVDAQNRIWVGTSQAGLAMLDTDRRTFRHYDSHNTPGIGSDNVWSVTSTPDGAIWFGTASAGLHRLDPDGRVQRFVPRPDDVRSLPSLEVSQLRTTADGDLWIATRDGAARWNGRDFDRVPPSTFGSPVINSIGVQPDGTLWFGTPRGVGMLGRDGRFDATPFRALGEGATVLDILVRDRAGQYWFDTPQGMGIEQNGRLQNVPLFSASSQGIVRPSWTSSLEDREGGVWFGSAGNGLWYLPANWRQFALYSRQVDDPTSLGNAAVHGIASSSDGSMWLVGTGGVLDRLDPRTGAVTHVARDFSEGYIVYSVLEGRAGYVWMSYHDGLVRLDPRTGHARRWTAHDERDPVPSGSSYLAQTPDGLVWTAGQGGEVQARTAEGVRIESIVPGDLRGPPEGGTIQQIGVGPNGALWLAWSDGLSQWDYTARRFVPVPGAPSGTILSFAQEGRDRMWIARLGVLEAYRWDGDKLTRVERLDRLAGMPEVALNGLAVDPDGVVWATTVRGLLRVEPKRRVVRVYGVRDGLSNQEFPSRPVMTRDRDRILVGSPDGLVMFAPADVHPSVEPPRLLVQSVDVSRADLRTPLDASKPIVLKPGDRDLRVVARLLSFNDARNHAFRFRLRGYDADWVDVDSTGERVYSQLDPGDYTLQIVARAADNIWSPPQTLSVSVQPPWWQTWIAMTAFAGIVVAVGWWSADAYRRRLKRRHAWQLSEREREFAEQASLAKTRFLATLGHEVRTPMTGVLGMSELLLDTPLDGQQRSHVESIRRAGRHLLRLVNDALDLARIESGRLELADEPFDLRDVVDEATTLMAPLAKQKGLAFRVVVDDDAPAGMRGDASRVCQILLNLLANAIKFTERGCVELRVGALSPRGVRFEVLDTGPGLSREQQARLFRRFEQAEGARTAARYGGSGLGLAICQELSAEMGGSIELESAPGEGARFIVVLPLPHAVVPGTHDDAQALLDSRGGPLTLLLVEDDPTVAEVICGLLRAQGHRVTHVSHALAALAESATGTFDAALLDLDLPGMDGLALASHLRMQGFDRPLLAITARADADAEPQAMAAGFQGFLRKPVTGAMLAALLQGVPRVEMA
ncbi:ligand-binding sensor domain-containing protein [Lysobacter soli]|uniref:ligand-binding sensor domain-containing protein n=1 Tax=Lysobacter soli TaxID=453783 RepID=UPI00240F3F41|nr:hybrid sensor histidine kinase/response regulator [Lysobacter soli]MDG2519048.1 two-component regulator propeller domain-containing protein [Lysobacter soli]